MNRMYEKILNILDKFRWFFMLSYIFLGLVLVKNDVEQSDYPDIYLPCFFVLIVVSGIFFYFIFPRLLKKNFKNLEERTLKFMTLGGYTIPPFIVSLHMRVWINDRSFMDELFMKLLVSFFLYFIFYILYRKKIIMR